MVASVYFDVSESAVLAELKDSANDIERLIGLFAIDLARSLADAGEQYAEALGGDWSIDGLGSVQRRVSAPEDAWWAHFIAHGTADHGPTTAPALIFAIDGELIFAEQVRGMAATDFDEKAVSKTKSHLDDILRRTVRD